jgi:hypothetical protein
VNLERWRDPDGLEPLPEELEHAVAGLRAFVEPTPGQLQLSYQRVQQTLAALPPPVLPRPVLPQERVRPMAVDRGAERALRARRALWGVSGGVTAVALVAGFTIGRWTREVPPAVAPGTAALVVASVAPVELVPSQLPVELVPSQLPVELVPSQLPVELVPSQLPVELVPIEQPARTEAKLAAPSAKRPSAPAAEQLCPSRDPVLRAECLLRRQQPQQALTALRGASTQRERERERVLVLTLLARCQLGQEVRSLGKRFFAQWPDSPLTWRIRNECPSAEPGVDASLQRADVSPALGR